MQQNRITCIGFVALFAGIAMMIGGGVMLGVGIHKMNNAQNTIPSATSTTKPTYDRNTISQLVQQNIVAENIKQNLYNFTRVAHQAGTAANKQVSDMIVAKWKNAGLQDVHTVSYNVLLSYPNWDNPNHVTIKDSNGKVVFQSTGVSQPFAGDDEQAKNVGIQWLAYSPNGTVTAPVVYCFKGYERDFQRLAELNITVTGKIALIRYGGSFRGDKVKIAQQHGAVGVILYSDPAEVAVNGTDSDSTYPNTVYMPKGGVQRGTIYNGDGDLLSPLYPSKQNLWRSGSIEQSKAEGMLPSIPAIPVSYATAMELFKRMTPNAPPHGFKGGLNTTYNLGPGLVDGMTTTISVSGNFEIRTIQDVVGYIYGSEEPDRYIMMGNHYDAWVYGAMDPNAGTAVLAEMARAVTQTMNETGWRPARTLMFANWDAEEFGLIGSTEFVEEFGPILDRRAVVYLNMDCLKGNTTLYVQATPSLQSTIFAAAKSVENPRKDEAAAGRSTLYDTWLHYYADTDNTSMPFLGVPMGGSDQKNFLDYLGIPSVSFYFVDPDKHFTYPLYHTLYDSYFLSEHLVDTDGFTIHRAIGQYWIEMAIRFADQPTIPYSFTELAHKLAMVYIPNLATSIYSLNQTQYTADGYKQLQNLATTLNSMIVATKKFESNPLSFEDPVISRSRINDKQINFERCFVNPRGAPGDFTARHVLYSVSKNDDYAGTVMQQVYAVVDAMSLTTNSSQLSTLGNDLANQISIVHYSVQCAINTLNTSI